MFVFKCKMCGGALEIQDNTTIATCEYCGTQQTLPKLDDDRRANLYDRANHFRRNNEFDKAMGIYEQILNDDNTDAEAYWSLVLCRYGIEYVEDPVTHKRVPTVNRAQFTSVFDDDNYKSALQYADGAGRRIYEEEANVINEIQKGILAISQQEEPFDVFICYKETDNSGRRTQDSVLANDLYHQLTQEGFKVFFARITLEDKLGSAYEPYIFAALNSAKVMVVLGTKPEFFNAVWVKNEWSRYLGLIKQGQKKLLIPAYKDMDPYDLPEEFSHLQAQDMSKLGFMQDLIRGIKKIIQVGEAKTTVVKETVVTSGAPNVTPLLQRAFLCLEDGAWEKADEFCEQVLNQEPQNAEAYLGKLMAELRVRKQEALKDCGEPFDNRNNYQKAYRFGSDALKEALAEYNRLIIVRNNDQIYDVACKNLERATTISDYATIRRRFQNIASWKDANDKIGECNRKIAELEKENAKNAKRRTIIMLISVAVVCFVVFFVTDILPAIRRYQAIESFKKEIKNLQVGDTIAYGTYEQDNNTSNGREAIEWIVLDKKDGKALLISKYALDCQRYNTSEKYVTWETCALRSWLNSTFYTTAFNVNQQSMIASTTLTNPDNPSRGTEGGNNTTDKVFLLSIGDTNQYFSTDSARKCTATAYVKAQGAYEYNNSSYWWLRSPGHDSDYAVYVNNYGSVDYGGLYVGIDHIAVRPALWINLES